MNGDRSSFIFGWPVTGRQVYHQSMTRAARTTTIPSDDQLLCERCGYVISGLPPGVNCPECGAPTEESAPDLRRLPAWEDPGNGRPEILRFLTTTLSVTFRPRAFYRSLVTRHAGRGAYGFAVVHWALSSLLLGVAVYLHARWFAAFAGMTTRVNPLIGVVMVLAVFFFLELTTSVAARLTHWEASYRGLRLPMPVVLRAMYYHAAHYVPVCAAACATVAGYQYLLARGGLPPESATTYLYVLCAEVIVAAFYLFKTYWTAMRNVMYANR
jgi:hypothetical protein